MFQEMVYQTASGTADAQTGGVQLNLIPKDGGNRFSGSSLFDYMSGAWQSNNLSPYLSEHGVKAMDQTKRQYDVTSSFGGPVIKDKLWFMTAARLWGVDKPVSNTFYADGSQGISDERTDNASVRLTWQATPRNKFAAYFDRVWRHRGHGMGAGDDPATASVVWFIPVFATGAAKWTSTVSNKMLIEAGYSFNRERYENLYQPGIEQPYGSAAWYAGASRIDNGFSTRRGASAAEYWNLPDKYNVQAAVSYVTGSHAFKAGFVDSFGPYRMSNWANADLYQNYTNGTPTTVTVLNTPIKWQDNQVHNLGLYAQDSWTLKRMTLNARPAVRLRRRADRRAARAVRALRERAGARRHRRAALEGHLAAHVDRVRPVREREDRGAARLQPVRNGGDDRPGADVRPERDDHRQPGLDRSEQGRHRTRRTRLHLPDSGMRNELQPAAGEFRHHLAGQSQSGPQAPVQPASTTSASRTSCSRACRCRLNGSTSTSGI